MLNDRISLRSTARSPKETPTLKTKGLVSMRFGLHSKLHAMRRFLVGAMFLAAMVSCPSLRADIIYNVSTGGTTTNASPSMIIGNTFSTNLTNTTLKSISLYLSTADATGLINLNIYATQSIATYGYRPTGSSLALATYSAASITRDTGLYTFNFTGANAITLNADTHYAFAISPDSGNLSVSIKTSNPYPNENFFSNTDPNKTQAVSGIVEVTAVPEPGTLILFGVTMAIGSAAAVARKRRKRNND